MTSEFYPIMEQVRLGRAQHPMLRELSLEERTAPL
jgi:hypothetical protein